MSAAGSLCFPAFAYPPRGLTWARDLILNRLQVDELEAMGLTEAQAEELTWLGFPTRLQAGQGLEQWVQRSARVGWPRLLSLGPEFDAQVRALTGQSPPWRSLPPLGLDLTISDLRGQGILSEVVIAALVQSLWYAPGQDWKCLLRCELDTRFRPELLAEHNGPFDQERIHALNRQRMQELTPRELLDHSRPFWAARGLTEPSDPEQSQRYEAIALLVADRLDSLLDLPTHLADDDLESLLLPDG